jgi:hypothetical protein
MSKRNNPLLEALKEGKSYTWTEPEGGDLASMRNAIKHGQTLTLSPLENSAEIQVGDIVLVKWRNSLILHMVGEINGDQYLIVNSLGKVNGWVTEKEILGKVTKIVEPEPRPGVPVMLEQLFATYTAIIQLDQATQEDTNRLYSIVEDLRWYAQRIGVERWNKMPRSNKWSFEQNLAYFLKEARKSVAPVTDRIHFFMDRGKQCVGLASEIFILLEYGDLD